MADLARHVYRLDWARTTAYATTPSSNGIHIVRAAEPGAPGVAAADYERFRAELAARLRGVTDPATGQPIVTGIWTREEAFDGPRGELAPDLTLALRDGGLVSILPAPDGVPLRPRPRPSGAHRPEGIFIAAGPAIRPGICVPELSILDVAPTLLYSLSLPIPCDLEGTVPDEILKPDQLRAQPVQHSAPDATAPQTEPVAVTPQPEAVHPVLDAEGEATILARLRALGYVE
jgi:predicted AlkP superfamily phosphohydrolase/phosphomutase